ncbi:MAG: ABC transporter permease [Actinomycetota bacterium]
MSALALTLRRSENRERVAPIAGAIGVGATVVLLVSESSFRFALALLAVALIGLLAFDLLAEGALARATALVPLLALLALAETFWLQGDAMRPDVGVILQGALVGALSALLAVGLALVYRANRVINFAQGDLGAVPAVLAILLLAGDAPGGAPDWMTGLPYVVVLVVGLAAAILLGFLVERLIVNRFVRAPRLVLTVATIGVAQVLTGLALFMPRWFGFKSLIVPDVRPPFEWQWEVGGTIFHENDLIVMIAVPFILAGLTAFLRYSRVGIAIRATAERSDRAASLGVPTGRIQTSVWVITTILAFVTVFLRAGVASFPIGSALGVTVLIRALAAVVIGRLEDYPRIALAALALGVVEQAVVFDTGRDLYVFPVLFAIVVVAMTLHRRRRGSRVEDQAVSSWQAARELRPVPRELRSLPEVQIARGGILGAIAVFLMTLPLWMSGSNLSITTDTGIIAIIAVSLVILTGWAGHVSLGQMAFAGVGGAVSAWITQTAELDFGFALLCAGLVGAAVTVVVGIPAARAGGLTLAVSTLALAAAVMYCLLNPDFFGWLPRGRFDRDPELFGRVEIASQMSFYYITLGVLALSIAVALRIRHTRTGRVLIALRENPRAAQAYGVNTTRTMLAAFAFSGFIAAMAGALSVHHMHAIPLNFFGHPFSPEASVVVFATVVIGGLASIPGAVLGAVYVYTVKYHLPEEWEFLATGFGLLIILLLLPGGLGAALAEVRDALLRWRARARGIVVPSLLADRRVEAVEVTPAMAAAVAEAVELPQFEEIADIRQ